MAIEESDRFIVLRDGRTDHMGKGATDTCNLQRQLAPDRVGPDHAEPTFLQGISIKAGASKAHRFQNLYGCLDEPLLHAAWRKLNKNGAPGVDKETVAQYGKHLDTNIKQLVERLKRGDYRSRLIRRVYIPKGNGKERPLGIPVVEDRLLQGPYGCYLRRFMRLTFCLPATDTVRARGRSKRSKISPMSCSLVVLVM